MMPHSRGFSLIEAVVAASILLLTCAAVSVTFTATLRAKRAVDRRSALESAADSECERLTALPFWRRVTSSTPLTPTSLVAEVFPHARSECNTLDASYLSASGPGGPGTFVTRTRVNGVSVQRIATFLAGARGEETPLPDHVLRGWAVWDGASVPPATTLCLAIRVSLAEHVVTRDIELVAVRPSVEPSGTTSLSEPTGAPRG
jgi:type II secretory pathway pseudopilin PulG